MVLAQMLCALLFAAGCPYEAKTSLGGPDPNGFDKQLLGRWHGTDAKGGDPIEFLVLRFNDAEYYVEVREKNGEIGRFRVHPIRVDGHPMLQINEIDPDGAVAESYFLARYVAGADGAIALNFIGEQIVPKAAAGDAKAIGAFLIAHWDDPELDDADTSYILRRSVSQPPPGR
jgi:hypothetical protein